MTKESLLSLVEVRLVLFAGCEYHNMNAVSNQHGFMALNCIENDMFRSVYTEPFQAFFQVFSLYTV